MEATENRKLTKSDYIVQITKETSVTQTCGSPSRNSRKHCNGVDLFHTYPGIIFCFVLPQGDAWPGGGEYVQPVSQ